MKLHHYRDLVYYSGDVMIMYVIKQWGNSALMKAGWRGETEVVSLLVKAGAALDLQDKVNVWH